MKIAVSLNSEDIVSNPKRGGAKSYYQQFRAKNNNSTFDKLRYKELVKKGDFREIRNLETRDIEGAYPNRFNYRGRRK